MVGLLTAWPEPPAPPRQGPSSPRAEHTPAVLCEPGTPLEREKALTRPLHCPPEGQCPRQNRAGPQRDRPRQGAGRAAVPPQPPAGGLRLLPCSACRVLPGRSGSAISPRAPSRLPAACPGIICPAAVTLFRRWESYAGRGRRTACLNSTDNAFPVNHTMNSFPPRFLDQKQMKKRKT